jgi:hypothetical protein
LSLRHGAFLAALISRLLSHMHDYRRGNFHGLEKETFATHIADASLSDRSSP